MRRSPVLLAISLAIAVAVAWGDLAATGAQAQPAARPSAAPVSDQRALLDRYCVACHNQRLQTPPENPLMLDRLDEANVGAAAAVWEKVARKLRTGAMPPAGRPRPAAAEADAFVTWLEGELDRAATAHPNVGRQPAVRRLTRTEYGNAVRDLLALQDLPRELDLNVLLPADNTVGFDNIAELLFVTPTLMEGYLTAARKISRVAVGDPSLPLMVDIYRLPPELPQDDHFDELPLGTRGGILLRRHFPLNGEYEIRIELTRGGREPHQLELAIDGRRVELFPLGGQTRGGGAGYDEDGDGVRVRVPVQAGARTVSVAFVKRTSAASEALVRPYLRGRGQQPSVTAVTITGPHDPDGPGDTPSRRRIFVCRPARPSEEARCARDVMATLARRAYRRPVTDADLEPLLAFYDTGRTEAGFEGGIQSALERLLVSPEFLLRIEQPPAGVRPGAVYQISAIELASRLSFFLWSSIPDDELLTLAATRQLGEPAVFERQVRRMLADPRSDALVSNFVAQWLFLRDLESRRPNDRLFPDFDDGLRQALVRETELFFDSLFRNNRRVLDLVAADYTFVNERLARHYGIPHVYGSHFRRVELGEGSLRGGLLGMGSILTLTSYATRTSPVVRGKWVLENILGAPPPPPPPDVPALKDTGDDGKVLSMRERMARHRTNAVCASCHSRMDPLGFALEHFDAVGRSRAHDEADRPIDASGVLPDGTTVNGVAGLRQLLAAQPEPFVTTVTEKLLIYALGRELGYFDQPAVRRIVREAARDDYRVASIVLGIVTSAPFRMRRSES